MYATLYLPRFADAAQSEDWSILDRLYQRQYARMAYLPVRAGGEYTEARIYWNDPIDGQWLSRQFVIVRG